MCQTEAAFRQWVALSSDVWNPESLARLAQKCGFVLAQSFSLPSYCLRGLWSRLCTDRHTSSVFALAAWLLLVLVRPVFFLLPSDIWVGVFRREENRLADSGKKSPLDVSKR